MLVDIYYIYIFFKGSVFMSEETKQEEVKEEVNKPDDNKEESNVVSIFLILRRNNRNDSGILIINGYIQ